jgi:hypothetical protein
VRGGAFGACALQDESVIFSGLEIPNQGWSGKEDSYAMDPVDGGGFDDDFDR